MGDVLYKSIDKNMIKSPVAYCKSHHCYLTKKQMRTHRCIARGCTGLQEIDEEFWEKRRERKQKAKKKRKERFGVIEVDKGEDGEK